MYPDYNSFVEYANEFPLVPVRKEYLADFETPISIFSRIAKQKNVFLLESVEGGEKWARYSFIGKNPFLVVTVYRNTLVLSGKRNESIVADKPMQELEKILQEYKSPVIPGMPPFTGGAVGYFSYNITNHYEQLPNKDGVHTTPDARFLFCDEIIAYDHKQQKMHIIANVLCKTGDDQIKCKLLYRQASQRIDNLYREVTSSIERNDNEKKSLDLAVDDRPLIEFQKRVASDTTQVEYHEMVEKAKDYIRAGDVFQVVLSQKWSIDTYASPFETYRILRTLNPSPYMYYLDIEGVQVVGTSPELLVRVTEKCVETRPIAGTRPRGNDEQEDKQLELNLLQDYKEIAEHLMLVDLGRNDVGRVSDYGTVEVSQFMEIERYSHVMHIVSHVKGQLKQTLTPFDALQACFPAGTVSGAPKVRAMEIISELEKQNRGLYAGAIGYLSYAGNFDSCITIRTIIFENNLAWLQAGAGVVYDSNSEKEYQETINKARALMRAIEVAEQTFYVEARKDE